MFVCVCNAVTDRDIEEAVSAGATNLRELKSRLGVASQCGSCATEAMQLLEQKLARPPIADKSLYYAIA